MNTEKDILLRRIANHLILHSIDIEDIGLFHGRWELCYSLRTTQDIQDSAIYDDFAGELLEEICEKYSRDIAYEIWRLDYVESAGESNI